MSIDIEVLIFEVFSRPILWDKRDPNHHNRYILDKLWDQIARRLNSTRQSVRSKWKSLRDKYRLTLVHTTVEKRNSKCLTVWPYYESLGFLKDQFAENLHKRDKHQNEVFLKTEDCSSSYDENSLLVETTMVKEEKDDSVSAVESNFDNPIYPSTSYTPPPRKNTYTLRPTPMPEDALDREARDTMPEDEGDIHFFKSLLPLVRQLNQIQKLNYRMQVLQVTQEHVIKSAREAME